MGDVAVYGLIALAIALSVMLWFEKNECLRRLDQVDTRMECLLSRIEELERREVRRG